MYDDYNEDIEHCDECDVELEEGRIGHCDDCIEGLGSYSEYDDGYDYMEPLEEDNEQ